MEPPTAHDRTPSTLSFEPPAEFILSVISRLKKNLMMINSKPQEDALTRSSPFI